MLHVTSDHNLMTGNFLINLGNGVTINWNQWKADGFDGYSLVGDPKFVDGADSSFGLTGGSYAIGAGELPATEEALEEWLEWNVGPQDYEPGSGMASIIFIPAPEPGMGAMFILMVPLWLGLRRGRRGILEA